MNELTLTAMLTTISAASASFVAILGGFIASKLLSINGERDAVAGQIANLSAQVEFKKQRKNKFLAALKDDAVWVFIIKYIDEIFSGKTLEEVYKREECCIVSVAEITPYWKKVNSLRPILLAACDDPDDRKDAAGIPVSVKLTIQGDDFLSKVIPDMLLAVKHIKEKSHGINYVPLVETPICRESSHRKENERWQHEYWQKIKDLSWDIDQLELQKGLLEQRKKELNTPYGMRRGLIIFALFSFFNIVIPLTQCNTVFKNPMFYYGVMLFFMVTFTLGLAATFCYLVSMLKWRPAAKVPVLPPEEDNTDDDEKEEMTDGDK